MSQRYVFAVVVTCNRSGWNAKLQRPTNETTTHTIVTDKPTKAEARSWGFDFARQTYPQIDGWENHGAEAYGPICRIEHWIHANPELGPTTT